MLNQLHDEIAKVVIFYETLVVLGTHFGVNGSKDLLTGMDCGFLDSLRMKSPLFPHICTFTHCSVLVGEICNY